MCRAQQPGSIPHGRDPHLNVTCISHACQCPMYVNVTIRGHIFKVLIFLFALLINYLKSFIKDKIPPLAYDVQNTIARRLLTPKMNVKSTGQMFKVNIFLYAL